MMKSVRAIYTRYVGGGLSGESGLIHIVNNVVNDRNCGFVFAPKTFDTIVTLSNFLVCVLGLCRFSFVLYHFFFYPCPGFLHIVHSISRFFLYFFLPSYSRYSLQSLSLSVYIMTDRLSIFKDSII